MSEPTTFTAWLNDEHQKLFYLPFKKKVRLFILTTAIMLALAGIHVFLGGYIISLVLWLPLWLWCLYCARNYRKVNKQGIAAIIPFCVSAMSIVYGLFLLVYLIYLAYPQIGNWFSPLTNLKFIHFISENMFFAIYTIYITGSLLAFYGIVPIINLFMEEDIHNTVEHKLAVISNGLLKVDNLDPVWLNEQISELAKFVNDDRFVSKFLKHYTGRKKSNWNQEAIDDLSDTISSLQNLQMTIGDIERQKEQQKLNIEAVDFVRQRIKAEVDLVKAEAELKKMEVKYQELRNRIAESKIDL